MKTTEQPNYHIRNNRHDYAADMLVVNGILKAEDKKTFTDYLGSKPLQSTVVAGQFIEQYVIDKVINRPEMQHNFLEMLYYFVNIQEQFALAVPVEEMSGRVRGFLSGNGMTQSKPGYRIDLSGLKRIPLLKLPDYRRDTRIRE